MCVCMCVCETERERERVCVCVCGVTEFMCIYVFVRMCMRACVCESVRARWRRQCRATVVHFNPRLGLTDLVTLIRPSDN